MPVYTEGVMSEIKKSLKSAVLRDDLCRVYWCIDQFDRSYWEAWWDGYNLLIDAIERRSREIVILLLKAGFKVKDAMGWHKTTPLMMAIEKNDAEIVDMLLERCVDPNAWDRRGRTPLHEAVSKGNATIVSSLLNKKAQVNTLSHYGRTPLYIAVEKGNLQIIECLLNHGARVNSAFSSINRYTPLHFAVEKDNEKLVELLLSRGADINASTTKKSTALHIAVKKWRRKTLRILLEQGGGNIDALDENGQTILQIAIKKGNVTTVTNIMDLRPQVINHVRNRKYLSSALNSRHYKICEKVIEGLLGYGCTVNSEDANDGELLHAAVRKRRLKLIERLLECGADVNATDGNGRTSLRKAVDCNHIEAAKLLIKYGADVNAIQIDGSYPISSGVGKDYPIDMTTLLLSSGAKLKDINDMFNRALKEKSCGIVEIILRKWYLDVNASDKLGWTALHHAIFVDPRLATGINPHILPLHRYAARDIAEAILNRGADVNARTESGTTALHIAVCCQNAPCVEILLKYGANVNSVNNYEATPLHCSAAIRNGAICKMLLDKGASVNAKDKEGNTPLHVACKKSYEEVVATLLEYGADIDSGNNENALPLQYAVQFGSLNVVKMLLKLFPDVEWRDEIGRTALLSASKFTRTEVFEELLDYGCNFDVTCYNGFKLLQYISRAPNHYYNNSRSYVNSHMKVLKRHIVKIKALNLYVSQQNLDSVDIKGKYEYFYIECKIEAEMMKNEKINDTNVSFHDLLTKGVSQLAIYARNEHIADVLESGCYKDKFPIYAKMLYHNFEKGQIRQSLLNSSKKSLNFLSGFGLPELTSVKLLSHLSNKDLRSLIKAAGMDTRNGKTVISVG